MEYAGIRRSSPRLFRALSPLALLLLGLVLAACGGHGGGGETGNSGSGPVVTTLAATSITETSGILNGTAIPNGLPTRSWFEYGQDSGLTTVTSSPPQELGDGLTSQAANMTWSRLESGRTYYFRYCAENSKGTTRGLIVSFTTSSPGNPPVVSTLSATSVGAAGGTLNGNVTPNGLATTAWFEWGTDPSMTTYSSTPTQSVGSGTTSQSTSAPLSGLSTGTTYHYRVAASNGSGTKWGSVLSFTPGAAPTATTLSATSVGAAGGTLNGNVTPNGLATTAWFEWGTDPSMTNTSSTPTQSVGSGTTSQSTSAPLSGLSTGTTYHYRVAASNGSGTKWGSVLSFTPGAAPTATTLSATSVGAAGGTLNGNVTPNGLATTAWFEWGTDPSMTNTSSTPTQSVGSGTTSQSTSAPLSGLSTGTTYHYRVAASNGSGTKWGSVLSFTPGAAPTATTLSATSVGAAGGTLNGNVTPNGLATTAWFEWGTDPSMTTYSSTPTQSVGSGTTSQSTSAPLSGLSTGTTYHYRVAASNGSGTKWGSVLSFTPGAAPTATTLSATSVGAAGGTLNGNVTPNGLATTAWFEWGTDPSMTNTSSTPTQSVGSGTTSQSTSAPLSGLSTGTTYHYRVAASNGSGTKWGSVLSFTPGAAPTATTLSATSVGAAGGTLNGNVTPNGLATTAWFEWGTDPSMTTYSSTPTQSVGSGTTSQSTSAQLSGLDGGVAYYYRVVAMNTTGESIGETLSFTTSSTTLLPTVTTSAATSITISRAELNGVVNPNGTATNAWFEYGTDPSLSTRESTASQAVGSGFTALPFSASVSGLSSYETYYFRMVASNAGGTQKGAILSFLTDGTYVAVGDSITQGTGDDIPEDGIGYEPILEKLLTDSRGYLVTGRERGSGGRILGIRRYYH